MQFAELEALVGWEAIDLCLRLKQKELKKQGEWRSLWDGRGVGANKCGLMKNTQITFD